MDIPYVDYNMLAGKICQKRQQMGYWSIDSQVENYLRTILSVLVFDGVPYDTHSPMATDIREACYKYLSDVVEPYGANPEHMLADRLRDIHHKHFNRRQHRIGY